jgi:TetR/AcrR family transcriptional repressor of nem operon
MGRTSNAREKIVNAAHTLFERRGYSALGVAEISAAAGVPKGSFYYFFESKQALALTVIEEHWELQRQQWAALLESEDPPLERLVALLRATAETQRQAQRENGIVTGCLFGNLALELSNLDETIRARLQEIFDEQIVMVEDVVGEAEQRGDVVGGDTRNAAHAFVALLEGMVLFAKLLDDPRQIDLMVKQSLALVGASPSAMSAGVGRVGRIG